MRVPRLLLIEIFLFGEGGNETFGNVMIDKQRSPLWVFLPSVRHFRVSAREFIEHHGVEEILSLIFVTVCLLCHILVSIMQWVGTILFYSVDIIQSSFLRLTLNWIQNKN